LLTAVIVFALFHVVLGFVVAYGLAWPWLWENSRAKVALPAASETPGTASPQAPQSLTNESATDASAPTLHEQSAEAPKFSVGDLPTEWLDQLTAEGIAPNSLVEASAHIVRLEVGRYREQLVTAETRARAQVAERNPEGLAQLAGDLRHINDAWLERQGAAAKMLGERKDQSPEHEEVAGNLERSLLDQAAQIKDATAALAALDWRSEVELGGKQTLEKIAALIDQAHGLRDRIGDLVATLLASEGRLDSIGNQMQLDRATGLPNRVGLEVIFDQWWKEDPQRKRHLSACLVDVDHFARINQRLGTRVGDRTLAAFAQLLAGVIRKDRGYDRIARVGGETFLLFYGDTEISNGVIAAERARQTLEATTWDDQGTEFDLHASCGVVHVGLGDTLPDVLRRARAALRFAKQAGRNRVAVDEGKGPETRDPPQFSLKGRVIKLEADA
jgi:diguanylate cyclase (GGDEF)-like protein